MEPYGEAVIETERLRLTPLCAQDADEMVGVLDDERLHEFVGGRPLDLAQLRERYAQLAAGSPRTGEIWLNWIVRLRAGGAPVGTVQATVTGDDRSWRAEVAWVVGVAWHGRGYASEAAQALLDWLQEQGAEVISAHIHPAHEASARVAARAGLHQSDQLVDGERVWRTGPPAESAT